MSKTTWTAFVIGIAFLGLTAAYIFGKIDTTGYSVSLGAVGTLGAMVIGKVAGDDKK